MLSVFKNSFSDIPSDAITFVQFIEYVKKGHWKKQIDALRSKNDEAGFKKLKRTLPAITISGQFKTRDKSVAIEERLIKHSGLICLDIDRKDNVNMRVQDLIDKECYAQFVSCSGEGIKVVYKCKTTKDAGEHRRIYDAAVQRLQKKGIKLKVDPIVKNIASLQYVTYDPAAYYFPKSKLVIAPLAPIKKAKVKVTEDIEKSIEELNQYIESLGEKDITQNYEDWLTIAFGLSYTLDELGREPFHRLSINYDNYNRAEVDELFDACLERKSLNGIERPVTLASVFQIINDHLPKVTLKHLAKKYNKGHAVGVGEDIEQGDLSGMVRYKLFLFKKVFDKQTNTLIDLLPTTINLNAFEVLLKEKGFYRYGKMYVHIIDNIVEQVDQHDILRIITKHIEQDGDYHFTYKKLEFHFSWEELVHLWRTVRGYSSTYNQISAGLEHWEPDLLKDTARESFIPYRNGVLHVTAKKIELIPYGKIGQQIWKERILPRDFVYTDKRGMFEEFFTNVCGRGDSYKSRIASEHYKRAFWYYGYMLQGSKRQSTARAWLLYDIRTGNNGRSGKTIIGQAIGKIRSMVIIDGKQVDFKNRFAFQTVLPWTDVVFIDDPSKHMSLTPLFNMITGELNADKKGVAPLIKSVKFMIASNWILEQEGQSEIGRQFVSQLDDFYIRYSKEHNNTITPIVDLHGKEFFTDWEPHDWAQFDSFSARALQHHLKNDAPSNTIIGNSEQIRFIQLHEKELFFELCNAFITQIKKGKDNLLLVPQSTLISLIREHNSNIGSGTAGKIARDFLRAIGAKEPTITSMMVNNMNRPAYKISEPLENLNFGEFGKSLPKPKF